MKRWLNTCNEEGISNGDALYMSIGIVIAFLIPIILKYIGG